MAAAPGKYLCQDGHWLQSSRWSIVAILATKAIIALVLAGFSCMAYFANSARVRGEKHGGPRTELLIELLLGNGAITNNSLLENGGDFCAALSVLKILLPFSLSCTLFLAYVLFTQTKADQYSVASWINFGTCYTSSPIRVGNSS